MFGAVGDGGSHPVGHQFGDTLDAAAAWRDRAGGRPHAWMADARFGLRFPMTVSAAQAAPGRVMTFLRKVPTIFGEETFAQFNGDPGEGQKQLAVGWLVSGPGIPPGAVVAGFDVANGTVTLSQATSAPLAEGTPVTLTIPPSVFQALEMDYVGTQEAVAAASSRGGGVVALPAGDYRWNRTVWNPGAADGPSLRGNASVVGIDEESTRIEFTADLGPGGCALGDRNRGPGSVGGASYARFRLLGPGSVHNDGTAVAAMDGLCVGQGARLDQVAVQRFHAGVNMVKDHGSVARSDVSNNFYGFYFGPNGDSIGNWELHDSGANANSWAGLAVAWNNQIDFSEFRNLDLGGGSPYAMYKEAVPAGQKQVAGFLSNSVLDHIFSEQVGMGWIYAENPIDQVDANICLHCTAWMHATDYKIRGRQARALVFAGRITGNTFIGSDLSNGGAHNRLVSEAIVLATGNIQANDWGNVTGAVLQPDGRVPYLSAPTVLFNRFSMDRGDGAFLRAEAPVRAGELLAHGVSSLGSGIRPMAAGRIFRGVAGQTVEAGQIVPVITTGLAVVRKTPDRSIKQGEAVIPSPADPTAVTSSEAGSGPVVGVWEGDNSGGTAATSGAVDLATSR